MATQNLTAAELAARRATVRHLADVEQLSNRTIGRRLGIHHRTVARDLASTAPPAAPAVAEQAAPPAPVEAPPAPTSGAAPAPRRAPSLLHPLSPQTIQDLNVLATGTGSLPAPLLRAIHEAAERRRTAWRAIYAARERAAVAEERAAAEEAAATGRAAVRTPVAS